MKMGLIHADQQVRETVRTLIASVADYQLLWEATDSSAGLARNAQLVVDLVLLELPGIGSTAAETTRMITSGSPSAVLLLASEGVSARASEVFDALGNGAMDATQTPLSCSSKQALALLAKLQTAARLTSCAAPRAGATQPTERVLVAIGASAGGPAALAEILNALPANSSAALVIVQHVDARFTAGMASWLAETSRIRVRLALDGDAPDPGVALLAGSSEHLVMTSRQRFAYVSEPSHLSNRPSIDVLFESISRHWHQRALGVLLTGMGHDGARGLLGLRTSGHHTIAQDAASSAIYGMPKEAARLDAAMEILPLNAIAMRIGQLVTQLESRA